MNKLLVNSLFKLAQEKVWLGELKTGFLASRPILFNADFVLNVVNIADPDETPLLVRVTGLNQY